ncbi:acyl-CoA synthetase [Microbulbifer sp. OS29]|uniref:Acyl-CoA synthetase n=1 Tax=Microbulbifer okhotskensis TaxID=2926617 RepID=A0A9X2EPW6_9GAMM|nr:acyl-CoA synthetase [Microbulbifer okhotskensis]MCO1335651.1 acyl-CoA synthetase [Microbulbifer okhotskensis]
MSITPTPSANPMLQSLEEIQTYEKIPLSQRYPWESTFDLIRQTARLYQQDTAIEFLPTAVPDEDSVTVNFSQLSERVHQTANLLHSLGVEPSDTISLLLPNLPETHFALWGGQAAGIASPINPLLEPDHIVEIMNATKAKVLVGLGQDLSEEMWEKVVQVIEQVPTLKTLLLISEKPTNIVSVPAGIQVMNFVEEIAKQPDDHLTSGRTIQGDDIASYFHTGGTTGRPKIARLTHSNIAFVAQLSVDTTSSKGRFATLSGLPLFHIFGTVVAGIGTLLAGRTIVIMTPAGFRSPNVLPNWWHHVARFRVQGFAAVPTILGVLLQIPVGDNDISCLTDIGCGASTLPAGLKATFEEKFNVTVSNGYGMTESSSLLARPPTDMQAPEGSVGRRLPYMEMQIAEVDGNRLIRTCSTGEVGIVLARGPHIFSGYLCEEDNAKAWVDHTWFNTGDMGYADGDGNLFLTGRAKDLIIRGGHNIDPALIEEPLARHPAVAMAVAIGQPDAYAGEVPVAYVTVYPSNTPPTEDQLIDYCRAQISERAAIPKRVEIIDEIPLTAVAKVFKPALRNRATEYVIGQALAAKSISAEFSAHFDATRGQIAQVRLEENSSKTAAKEALQDLPVALVFD